MPLAKVKIGVRLSDYNALAALCQTVIDGLTANPLLFPVPFPSIIDLTSHLADLNGAIAAWGVVGNRGSHADYVALKAYAIITYNDLTLETAYVQGLVNPLLSYADQAAFIAASGFSVRNPAMPQGVLGAPQDLHRKMSDSISEDDIMLEWKKPLDLTSPNNVKWYTITGFPSQLFSTKTKILATMGHDSLVHGTTYNITVNAWNDAGEGVQSSGLIINF